MPFTVPKIDSLTSRATGVGSSVLSEIFKNEHTKDFDDFKNQLGMGFRSNLYKVEFLFAKQFVDDLNDDTLDSSTNFKPIIRGNLSIDSLVSNVVNKITSGFNLKGSTDDSKKLHTTSYWNFLCTQFQWPYTTFTKTQREPDKNIKYITGSTPGIISATIINDEWNNNYSAIENIVKHVTDGGSIRYYPEQYKFDIILTLYSYQFKMYQQKRLINCSLNGVPDFDYNTSLTATIPTFNITMEYEKSETIYAPPRFQSLGITSIYKEEAKFILKNFGEGLLKATYLDIQQLLAKNPGQETIDYYNGLIDDAKAKGFELQKLLDQYPKNKDIIEIKYGYEDIVTKYEKLISDALAR